MMPNPDEMNKPVSRVFLNEYPVQLYPEVTPLPDLTPEEPLTMEQMVAQHPETNQQRAVLILTDCLAELTRCEAAGEDPPDLMFFSAPSDGKIGKNGFMALFPGMTNTPVGKFRGTGMACDVVETVAFIGVNFPTVMEQVMSAMYTEIDEPTA
jgi:hypothetical protein